MSEITTIKVTREVKDKLDKLKNDRHKSYNDVIKELLPEGTEISDVITTHRDSTAISLKYFEFENSKKVESYDITFQELKIEPVGSYFTAKDNVDVNVNHVNTTAEIIAKKGGDVLLLVSEIACIDGERSKITGVHHFNLF